MNARLTFGEQITVDRIRAERRIFVRNLIVFFAEVGAAILLLMRG